MRVLIGAVLAAVAIQIFGFLFWAVSPLPMNDLHALPNQAEIVPMLSKQGLATGVARIVRTEHTPATGWHLLGTARMGHDPQTSVVDARGRCHTTPNVIIADGSLFPTVGAVNPASTIGALALKIADDLANEVNAS